MRVAASPIFLCGPFVCDDAGIARRVERLQRRLPELSGAPLRLHRNPGLRDRKGPVHAGAYIRERRIAFNCSGREFSRIFVQEVFHFVWLHLCNQARWSFESVVQQEFAAAARGELGWSAEWRKKELLPRDRQLRTRRWREYCCEAFCDTAAWLYAGNGRHREFTLAPRFRGPRRHWFRANVETKPVSI